MPEAAKVALKVQRRCYARTAAREVSVHERIQAKGPCQEIAGLREAFIYDGHICMAYDLHGRSLESVLDRGPLPIARVRRVARQLLVALERLHLCGLAHTDLKPDNILYDARTGNARLADLGSARDEFRQGTRPGTREYYAPEILLGAPLSPALDLWSLGCTVFEMLTGHTLFLPYKEAMRKYREFSAPAAALPVDASVEKDEASEAAEQLARGHVVAGKYQVERVLGQGRFATVWSAREIASIRLAESAEKLNAFSNNNSNAESDTIQTDRERMDRDWRRAKGADDIIDLALIYEHFLLIARQFGPFPKAWVDSGKFRSSYFEADGELRFRPEIRRRSLRDRVRRSTTLRGTELFLANDFLEQLLRVPANERATAKEALSHPWVQKG